MVSRSDKIKGSLIAEAIGDALGYQIEFDKNIKERQITRYENIGYISDDTQMTLFTANALLYKDSHEDISYVDALYLAYLDWYETQSGVINKRKVSWIKDIEELHNSRAPGITCLTALSSGIKGTLENPINDSKGCGTVMRIAPIGLYIKDPIEAGKLSVYASQMTHSHELGSIPSMFESILINRLIYEDIDLEEAVNKTIEIYKQNCLMFKDINNEYFLKMVKHAIELSKKNISDIKAIKELGQGWVAEEAFVIGLYSCLKYKDNIIEALICAINHDGDSDSTGAIAGNILGAYLGYESIDKYYVDYLELNDLILEIAEDLCVEDVASMCKNEAWKKKYIKCEKS